MTGTVGRSDSAVRSRRQFVMRIKSPRRVLDDRGRQYSLAAQIKFLGKVVEFKELANY
jgi:hypothetical protein